MKNLWTKEFLTSLRHDYTNCNRCFFCSISGKFEAMWGNDSYRKQIKKLANAFLTQHSHSDIIVPDGKAEDTLFDTKEGVYRNCKEIRLSFLDHEIKRLSA